MLSTVPFPPASNTLVDDISRHASRNKLHRNPQYLHVLVPALIVEKQHLLIVYPTVAMYALEVGGFVTGVDLQMVEVVDCAVG